MHVRRTLHKKRATVKKMKNMAVLIIIVSLCSAASCFRVERESPVPLSDTDDTCSISGTVSGTVVNRIMITVSGDAARTAFTDSNGDYMVSHLANGSYTVTPSGNSCTFTPGSSSVTLDNNDAQNINFSSAGCAVASAIIADHFAVKEFDQYVVDPDFQAAIEVAKSTLHIGYGHTSHGSQITSGMSGFTAFMNNKSYPQDLFAWNNGGTGKALDLEEGAGYGEGWLDHDCGYSGWDEETRSYLEGYDPGAGTADHTDVNVIMWSWCGQVNDVTIQTHYLDNMQDLENEYPGVIFIYMTGHLEGATTGDAWFDNNNAIRSWVSGTDYRVLFDFADIEKYDPDQQYNYADYAADDACNYDSDGNGSRESNWATAWQNSDEHVQGVDWYSCSCAHSEALNCNQKAKAFWWMMARLGGWGN